MGEGIGQAVEIATTSDRAAATLDCVALIRPPIVIFPRSLSSCGPFPRSASPTSPRRCAQSVTAFR